MSIDFDISIRKAKAEKFEKYYVKSEALEKLLENHIEHIRLRYLIFRFIPIIIILLLCVFSYVFFEKNIFERDVLQQGTEIETNHDSIEVVVCENDDSYNNIEINNETAARHNKGFSFYQFITIVYFCILVATIIVLFIIFITDDTCLRFSKLDEMHDVKQKLLLGKFKESVDETTEYYDLQNQMVKNSRSKIQKRELKKHNDSELLKHYMTCITEL